MSINLISSAMAATTAANTAAPAPGGISPLLFMIAIILLFYVMLIRPQQKRAKEHRSLLTGLSKGDEVITSGGLAGKITKVNDDFIMLNVADGVEVKVQKAAIAATLPKGTLNSV